MGEKLSVRQAWLLITIEVLATSILYQPGEYIKIAGKDAWLGVLAIALLAVPASILVVLPGLRFPGQNFVQYSQSILGKISGKIAALLFVLVFAILMSLILREFGDLLIIAIMPKTPLSVFVSVLLAVSAVGVYLGIGVLGRTVEIIGPLVILFIFLVLVISMENADFSNLTPVLEHGWKPVLLSAFIQLAFMPQVAIAALLLDKIENPRSALKATLGFAAVAGPFMIGTCIIAVAVFTEEYAATLIAPLLSLARVIEFTRFVAKIDSVIVALWILGGFIKLSVIYYLTVSTLGQVIGLRDYRSLILPTGLITGTLSIMMFANIFDLESFLLKILAIYHPIVFMGIPALLLLVAVVRKKGDPTIPTLKLAFQEIKTDIVSFFSRIKQTYYSIVMPVDSDQ